MKSNKPYPMLCFTKPLNHLSAEDLVAVVSRLGFDGLDLVVRDAGPVTTGSAPKTLPRVVALAAEKGLKIGMITLPISYTDPGIPEIPALFDLCARLGIPFLKLGYWSYDGKDYRSQLAGIRNAVAGFERRARAAGVCALLHTHGNTLSQSASLLERILEGTDPRFIGAYLDTHHLSARGEDFDLAMDLAGDHLKMIAVKDGMRIKPGPEDMLQPFHHHIRMMPLGEGHVNFARFLDTLNRRGYDGPMTYHLEYDVPETELESVIRNDVKTLRSMGLMRAATTRP